MGVSKRTCDGGRGLSTWPFERPTLKNAFLRAPPLTVLSYCAGPSRAPSAAVATWRAGLARGVGALAPLIGVRRAHLRSVAALSILFPSLPLQPAAWRRDHNPTPCAAPSPCVRPAACCNGHCHLTTHPNHPAPRLFCQRANILPPFWGLFAQPQRVLTPWLKLRHTPTPI